MKIAASVLSLDFDRFKEEFEQLNKYVDWIHYDVMDGNFVPNISFGPSIMKQMKRNTNLLMDVHLMVNNPDYYAEVFIDNGADLVTFHYEAINDIKKCKELINKIHSQFIKVGISIKPNTPVKTIEELLPMCDLILVMSVEPGFGGQSFIPSSLDKIKELDKLKKENNYCYLIEVDGGVSDKNARELIEAGVNVLVAGSYIFKGDIQNNAELLRKANI